MADSATPFLEMFPCCDTDEMRGILKDAVVLNVTVNEAQMTMTAEVRFSHLVPPVQITRIADALAREYGLA